MTSISKYRGYKKIKVNGQRFIIQKINPLTDLPEKHFPQIFSHIDPNDTRMRKMMNKITHKEQIKNMIPLIKAGVVEPQLVDDPNEGLTAEDLFRDPMTGFRLFEKIIDHSLYRFRGLKGLFFSIVLKPFIFIRGRKYMANLLVSMLSQREGYQSSNK